jgi:effector-binding domain-containing protein
MPTYSPCSALTYASGAKVAVTAPDVAARNQLIATHLCRLESTLERTQQAAASLRGLLQPQTPAAPADLTHLSVASTPAAAVTSTIDIADALAWHRGALGELRACLVSQEGEPRGPSGGIFSNDLFAQDRGQATVFIPCGLTFRPTGRVQALVVPAAEPAMTTHVGSHVDIDISYGLLATYVTEYALAVDGPIREYYLVDHFSTSDQSRWRTQIGWPIFDTADPT